MPLYKTDKDDIEHHQPCMATVLHHPLSLTAVSCNSSCNYQLLTSASSLQQSVALRLDPVRGPGPGIVSVPAARALIG